MSFKSVLCLVFIIQIAKHLFTNTNTEQYCSSCIAIEYPIFSDKADFVSASNIVVILSQKKTESVKSGKYVKEKAKFIAPRDSQN